MASHRWQLMADSCRIVPGTADPTWHRVDSEQCSVRQVFAAIDCNYDKGQLSSVGRKRHRPALPTRLPSVEPTQTRKPQQPPGRNPLTRAPIVKSSTHRHVTERTSLDAPELAFTKDTLCRSLEMHFTTLYSSPAQAAASLLHCCVLLPGARPPHHLSPNIWRRRERPQII